MLVVFRTTAAHLDFELKTEKMKSKTYKLVYRARVD